MFRLYQEEENSLTSQFAISNIGRGGRRYLPYAFTEQGVAMLSACSPPGRQRKFLRRKCPLLKTVNIAIMRTL